MALSSWLQETVEVSLEEKRAQVTVDETVQDNTLVEAVKKAGYKGKIITREPVADNPEAWVLGEHTLSDGHQLVGGI